MSDERRAAIGELMNIISLLCESSIEPEKSKALACIVSLRLRDLATGGDEMVLLAHDDDIVRMVELAAALEGS
jgi:hypothetical protein